MSNGFDATEILKLAIADLPRPVDVVAIRPNIRSIEHAELALREAAWCAAVTAAIAAKAAELIADLQNARAAAATYQQGAEQVSIADRLAALETELLRWADQNRAALCPGRKKSIDLVNGRIFWRAGKDSVKRSDGVESKEAKELIGELLIDEPIKIEAGPLVAGLQRVVDAIGYAGAISVALGVNQTAATKAVKTKQLSAEQLAAIGYEFAPGGEDVTVVPAEFVRAVK